MRLFVSLGLPSVVLPASRLKWPLPYRYTGTWASPSVLRRLALLRKAETERSTAQGSTPASLPPLGSHSLLNRSMGPPKKASSMRDSATAYKCPACYQTCIHLNVFDKHLKRCCADLVELQRDGWDTAVLEASADKIGRLLVMFQKQEDRLRDRCLDLAFRDKDEDGNQLKRSASEIAPLLDLPEKRAVMLLKRAMQAVPLAVDHDPVEVIYEDEHLVAVNKPPGVSTAPSHRFVGGSMVNRMIGYLGKPPYVLHRLDMWTSGVLLFGKDLTVVPDIHKAFAEKTVTKSYLSISVGCPNVNTALGKEFTVDAPIDQSPDEKVARIVGPGGKPAVTNFSVVAYNPEADISLAAGGRHGLLFSSKAAQIHCGAALVRCFPRTGRTHQIRVHLAHVGHPLVGDELYGLEGPWIERQALHAASITLRHPATDQDITIQAPLPDDMIRCLALLGVADDSQ
mmetsp:Transcript_36794/g.103804  ORF Transcript_36794/g.103804 Transcript_36794/m.103804 type:complete len:455 (+) Transcript_36794:406-1770(+)